MRKIVLPLVIALFATPVWATDVDVSCTPDGMEVTINYAVTGSPAARAFALDISVDAGVIESISAYKVGESTEADPGFGIFPGNFGRYIVVDPDTGEVESWEVADYTPVADPCDPGALGGLGTAGITIEMGALYYPTDDGSVNAPATSGTLCKITVSEACTVSIAENVTRGGVVLTDPSVTPTVTLGTCDVVGEAECFPSDNADYDTWVALGRPKCWCAPPDGSGYQCDGDVDGATETIFKYRIYGKDLAAVVANWKKKAGDPDLDPCADIDHKSETIFKYQVYGKDLNTVVTNWKKKDADLPQDCPR